MSSEEQAIIEDEPLKVLGLFHKRDMSTIAFNEEKFLKLYDSLSCTICRQLFNNPVYLRCSHRFCKECIEKYIRFNQKKSCPNCRGDLNTKRDLRIDYSLTTLIRYAYGDRQKFIQDMTQIQNAEAISLQRSNSKSSAILRNKSFAEEQSKSIKKKVKVNEVINVDQITQQKPKKRKTTKSLESSKQIEDSRTEELRTQMYESLHSQKVQKAQKPDEEPIKPQKIELEKSLVQETKTPEGQNVKLKKKRGRKKQVPIIEVKSQSSQQPPELIDSIPMEIEQKTETVKNEYRSQNLINIKGKLSQRNIQEIQSKFDSFEKERKILKEQFGQNYLLSLMKVPTIDFIIEIKLQKHPHCFLTPVLACKSIQLSSKAKLHNVFVLMSKLLNLPIKNIQLYVNSSKMASLPYQSYKEKSIGQINEQIWKSSLDVQVFDMKQILSSLEQARNENNKQQQFRENKIQKRLFEGIQFQREQRSYSQTKKRGRSRIKKPSDKQNNIDPRDQVRRIVFYRIVSD